MHKNSLGDVQYITYNGKGEVVAEGGLKSRRNLHHLYLECLHLFGTCAGSQKDYISGKTLVWVFCRCVHDDDDGNIGDSCNFRRTVIFL